MTEEENIEADPAFRWRGKSTSRLESLADGVFALALALLAIGEVPRTGADLDTFAENIPALAASFLFLTWCWWLHCKFFRRFGMQDVSTVAANALLLFTVLFFVYPLGFLTRALITQPLFGPGFNVLQLPDGTLQRLAQSHHMTLYAVAFTTIFASFTLLHILAWRRREALELDSLERAILRNDLATYGCTVAIGAAAVILPLVGVVALGGMSFFLMGPVWGYFGFRQGRLINAHAKAGTS